MGARFTPEQAKHRVVEWSIRGKAIPDLPGGKLLHMEDKPRYYNESDFRAMEQLMTAASE